MLKALLLVALVAACLCRAHAQQQPPAPTADRDYATLTGPATAGDSRRGWHFYDDPEPEPSPPPPARTAVPQATEVPAVKAPRPHELVLFERLRKRVEEYRNIAIINPTEANVRRYMELESKVVLQASYFADVAQRVAWATPDLDMTLQGRPVNAQALQVFDRDQLESRGQTIAALGKSHVLFFFFRSDCPYCHAMGPTLEAFQARFGMNVVPISLDGGGLPNFPQFRRDNGISRTLQVSQVPAVFLAEPFTGKMTPIGFGVLSESQLLERITTVSLPGADAMVPSLARRISPPQ